MNGLTVIPLLFLFGLVVWLLLENHHLKAKQHPGERPYHFYFGCPNCFRLTRIIYSDWDYSAWHPHTCAHCGHHVTGEELEDAREINPLQVIAEMERIQAEDYQTILDYRKKEAPCRQATINE